MISLRLKVDPLPIDEPLVVRLLGPGSPVQSDHDAVLAEIAPDRREYDLNGFSFGVYGVSDKAIDGDVLMMLPGETTAHRLIRAGSAHNTLLVTEQCDQLCVMCSQPPKKYHADLFDQFTQAASLAPQGAMIGVSGGEPLLHKERLFGMLEEVKAQRPDVGFHILTNAQHFSREDLERLQRLDHERVLWGVPLYSATPENHDRIVGKTGAFATLEQGLSILMRAGASLELRTVVMQQNWQDLPALANYVSTRLNFLTVWAIMQLERIGYARMNWKETFRDTSGDFDQIARAVDIATARGLRAALYNFPLCSVPPVYQDFAPSTISDWKRKYLDFCLNCRVKKTCGGFFQWYSHSEGFAYLGPL
jgi:His-Xaa-Ser system radical SAM maturase HxsC